MIFDTWGGALADGAYERYSLDYIRRVVAQLSASTTARGCR